MRVLKAFANPNDRNQFLDGSSAKLSERGEFWVDELWSSEENRKTYGTREKLSTHVLGLMVCATEDGQPRLAD